MWQGLSSVDVQETPERKEGEKFSNENEKRRFAGLRSGDSVTRDTRHAWPCSRPRTCKTVNLVVAVSKMGVRALCTVRPRPVASRARPTFRCGLTSTFG
jgi:hypothetical protein